MSTDAVAAMRAAKEYFDDIESDRADELSMMLDAAIKAAQPSAISDERNGMPYGIIDPEYARIFTFSRVIAWQEGYALMMHGSFTRDLDLIAVPWTKTPCEPEHLINRIVGITDLKIQSDGAIVKHHGRKVWTLLFPGDADPRFVDFSILPRPLLSERPVSAISDEHQFRITKDEIIRIRNKGCGNDWPKVSNVQLDELCDAYEKLRSLAAAQEGK